MRIYPYVGNALPSAAGSSSEMQNYGGIRVAVWIYCPFRDGVCLGGGERFTCSVVTSKALARS